MGESGRCSRYFVLVMLAELFGVTVNDLLTEKHRKSHRAAPKLKRSIITLMSAGLVWLVAAVVFRIQSRLSRPSANLACIHLCNPRDVHRDARAVRALAPPIFSYLSVCGIVWGVALSVDISLNVPNVSLIYIIAAVLQVLIALWWLMKNTSLLAKFAFRTKQKAQKPLRTKRKVLPKNKFARFVPKQTHANLHLIPLKPKSPLPQ